MLFYEPEEETPSGGADARTEGKKTPPGFFNQGVLVTRRHYASFFASSARIV